MRRARPRASSTSRCATCRGATSRQCWPGRGRLEPARALALVEQVADALDAAHARGLVHRDVKPGNILVTATRKGREHVYLSDFGLTKHAAGDGKLTESGQFFGTADYVAPEQIEGGDIDGRADVYSLGCVLFECLAGQPPFRSRSSAGLLFAHLQKAPPSLTEERPELPGAPLKSSPPVALRRSASRCAVVLATARAA